MPAKDLTITCRVKTDEPKPIGDGMYAVRVIVEAEIGGEWKVIEDRMLRFSGKGRLNLEAE